MRFLDGLSKVVIMNNNILNMNPNYLQTFSQILILIGVIFTAAGGFGSYYFGKKVDSEKELKAETELTIAKNERKELKDILQPFIVYAKEKYPNESDSSSLLKLSEDIKDLEKKTTEINDKTLALEKKVAIWSLNGEQIKTISTELRKYENIDVIIYRENSPELEPFIDDLKILFNNCKWNIKEDILVFDKAYNGISLYGYSPTDSVPPYFFFFLYNLFNQNGIEVKELIRDEKMNKNTIGIRIGKLKY